MKKQSLIVGILLLLFFLPLPALAQGSQPPIPPAPTVGNVVLDTLDWLTPMQEAEINAINKELDDEGIAQMAVVTLDDCGSDKLKFRNDLFRSWGIGHKDDNDGLLIMVCWYGGDQNLRSVEQETGYGLEAMFPGTLTDQIAKDYFIPAFQADQPGNGLVAMVKRYDRLFREDSRLSQAGQPTFTYLLVGLLGVLPGVIFSTIYANIWRSGHKLVTKKVKGARKIVYRNEFMGMILPGMENIVLAEIISLIPVLALHYINWQDQDGMLFPLQVYSGLVIPYLFPWFVVLIVVYLSALFNSGKGWKRKSYDWWNSNGDGSSGGDSFGGGDSGGSGSSTGF